jgi:hypothetical protein
VAPELVPAAAQVVILGGGALVGRALELLLRSADCNVRFLGEPSLGKPSLHVSELDGPGPLDGARLLILAPGVSAGCREDALALISARTAEARFEVLELGDDRQEALVGAWEVLPWPCRTEDLKRRVMAALLDGPGTSQGGWGPPGLQKAREMVSGTGLD